MKILALSTPVALVTVTRHETVYLVTSRRPERIDEYWTESRDEAFNRAGEYAGFADREEDYRLACIKG